jgi:hypothetical protein
VKAVGLFLGSFIVVFEADQALWDLGSSRDRAQSESSNLTTRQTPSSTHSAPATLPRLSRSSELMRRLMLTPRANLVFLAFGGNSSTHSGRDSS